METNSIGAYAALVDIQANLKAPKGQYNSHGKYNYRSCEDILSAVKPLAHKHGYVVLLTDSIRLIGDRYYVEATATLTNGTEFVSATGYAREALTRKGMDESQITGASSSYARKYALNALFGIDDAKDADTDAYDRQTDNKQPAPAAYYCNDCGAEITETVINGKTYSADKMVTATVNRYGTALCMGCKAKRDDAANPTD